MIRGIGVDMVKICDMSNVAKRIDQGRLTRMFTVREMEEAYAAYNRIEYYATRFAAKEAVFKAVAPLLGGRLFDFRIVETLKREDGSPYVNVSEELQQVLKRANVQKLHISITTEGDYATAFVIAE